MGGGLPWWAFILSMHGADARENAFQPPLLPLCDRPSTLSPSDLLPRLSHTAQEWFALCDHAMSLALNRILDIVALVRALQAQNVKHNLVTHFLPQVSVCSPARSSCYNLGPA